MEEVVSATAFVRLDATLADARAKIEATSDCQDVFVTDTGDKDETLRGWLSNTRIAEKAEP